MKQFERFLFKVFHNLKRLKCLKQFQTFNQHNITIGILFSPFLLSFESRRLVEEKFDEEIFFYSSMRIGNNNRSIISFLALENLNWELYAKITRDGGLVTSRKLSARQLEINCVRSLARFKVSTELGPIVENER